MRYAVQQIDRIAVRDELGNVTFRDFDINHQTKTVKLRTGLSVQQVFALGMECAYTNPNFQRLKVTQTAMADGVLKEP